MIKQFFSIKRWLCAILVALTISVPKVWGTDLCNFTTFNGWPTSAYGDTKTYTPSTGVTWTFTGIYRQNTTQTTLQIKKNTSTCVITTPTFSSNIGTITVTFNAGAGTVYIKDASNNALGNSSFSSSSPASIDVSSSSVSQVKICVTENNTATAHITAIQITSASGGSSDNYVLVESDLDTDWAGDYLIAYSSTIFADGRVGGTGTGGIGASGVSVNPSTNLSGKVVAGSWGDTYNVTLEEISSGSNTYVLKTKDGKYNYRTANSNGLDVTNNRATAANYPITVTFNSSSNVALGIPSIGASYPIFHYNTSGYFRFYASGGQQAVYLYKKTSSCGKPTSVGTKNGSISSTGFTAKWTAPSSAPENGYYVAYSTSSSTPGDITASSGDYTVVSVGAGTTEKAISSLTDGGLYYFWVRSRCSASDNSGWSDRASVQLSKIALSQTSLTGMTYVYNGASGGPSTQSKSFTVTGTNVGGNLTVSAPTYFQVSTDNSSWGSSKTITATSGAASGTVYVRLAGGLNVDSYGSASTYVTVSDGGSKASSKNVSVQGSVTKANLNPSFGSATYNITRDVSTSTSFTLTNVPSDYTGDITYQRSNTPSSYGGITVDGTNKTFTATSSGSWTITAQFAADANYNAKASGVTCTVNAVTRDTYVDNVNGQSVTEAQRTDDGVNPYTSPALSDVAAGSACKGTKTHLIGWATATFIANVGNGTLTGADSDYTQANGFYAVGATLPAASGVTYYAVYGEEE